jgi:hypothetical protein
MDKPIFWPSKEKWPLPEGVYIKSEIETLPPVYVLSDGKEIRGEYKKAKCRHFYVEKACKLNNCRWVKSSKKKQYCRTKKNMRHKAQVSSNKKIKTFFK